MGIVDSQIQTERIFNMRRTITSFKHYRLGIKNINKLVNIMKK
jgi:hypothetical protein